MKPMFLPVLFHVTVVPDFTQKSALPFAFGMLGVEDAPSAVRFTSTSHGAEAVPHVFLALHNCERFCSEHAYLLPFACAVTELAGKTRGNASKAHPITKHRCMVTTHLSLWHSSHKLWDC
jgi:hypothetical protein